MLETADHGSGKTGTDTDRCVVKLIRDDQGAFANQCRESGGVRAESHRENHGSRLANELCNFAFNFECQIRCPSICSWTCDANPVLLDAFFDSICAWTF